MAMSQAVRAVSITPAGMYRYDITGICGSSLYGWLAVVGISAWNADQDSDYL